MAPRQYSAILITGAVHAIDQIENYLCSRQINVHRMFYDACGELTLLVPPYCGDPYNALNQREQQTYIDVAIELETMCSQHTFGYEAFYFKHVTYGSAQTPSGKGAFGDRVTIIPGATF